jgi:hypothetical protein
MTNRHAAEAIGQQHRDALLSQADGHRLVRSVPPEGRTAGPRTNPESRREPRADPTRVRRLVRRLAWGSR